MPNPFLRPSLKWDAEFLYLTAESPFHPMIEGHWEGVLLDAPRIGSVGWRPTSIFRASRGIGPRFRL